MEKLVSSSIYFSQTGKENTPEVLEVAYRRAIELGIKSVIVATTTGDSGAKAAVRFNGFNVVAVTHSTGFKAPNDQQLTQENRLIIEQAGGKILTTTHAFGGVNRAIRRKLDTYQVDEVIAYTLRIFGEGMKVTVETALMASDAGLINVGEPVLCIAGTGSGADTVVIINPAHAQSFFDLRIVEIICMPSPAHPGFAG